MVEFKLICFIHGILFLRWVSFTYFKKTPLVCDILDSGYIEHENRGWIRFDFHIAPFYIVGHFALLLREEKTK